MRSHFCKFGDKKQPNLNRTTSKADDIASEVVFTKLESGMRKRRNEKYPRLPTNIEEVDDLMKSASDGLNKHYKGILRDKDDKAVGVIFYHEELLKRMVEIKELGYDGTYFVVPEPYHQLWTIHLVSKGHFFPGLSILFTGASTDDYECAWKLLRDLLGDDFKPTLAKGDFETGPKKAGENIFPELLFLFCLFHYSQAEFRNLQKHGLQNEYENNEKFRVWMKLLMAVPLLPSHMITNAFTELLSENIEMSTPADELKFGQFKRYVQNYWLKIDPKNLSVYAQDNCTTNGCESYHAKLKKWIVDHNPAFWVFVINLNKVLDHYHLQYLRMLNPKIGPEKITRGQKEVTKRNLTIRRNAEKRLMYPKKEEERITWRQFLGIVSHTTDSLTEDLSEKFHDNGDQLLDDHQIFYDPNDVGVGSCTNCKLHIYKTVGIIPCGHKHLCSHCVDDLIKNAKNCPNSACGKKVEGKLELQ